MYWGKEPVYSTKEKLKFAAQLGTIPMICVVISVLNWGKWDIVVPLSICAVMCSLVAIVIYKRVI